MKQCTKCKEVKPTDEFRLRTKRGKPYRVAHCHECEKSWQREYNATHKTVDNRTRFHRHGLTREEYESLLSKRQGLCHNLTCSNAASVIDHDHDCCPGKVSCGQCVVGLLCHTCNTAEGMLESDAAKAYGLMEYMKKTRQVNGYVLTA